MTVTPSVSLNHPAKSRAAALRALWAAAGLLLAGCEANAPKDGLIVTQLQAGASAGGQAEYDLDVRYPLGSRIVWLRQPTNSGGVVVLSKGLAAAGDPVLSADATRVYFAARAAAGAPWQIYENSLGGGRPRKVTGMPGGAMNPALLPNGDLVFSSPVPKRGETWKAFPGSMLYAQSPGGNPRRLTYGSTSAIEPTVLGDGRILFVSARPHPNPDGSSKMGLFTINNDGTEVTAFALEEEAPPMLRRPRELPDGRVAFLTAASPEAAAANHAEAVRKARPFTSREPLSPMLECACTSVEPDATGALVVCLGPTPAASARRGSTEERASAQSPPGSCQGGIFRLPAESSGLGEPIYSDPAWPSLEAVPVAARPKPMGHMSAITPGKGRGTILCLNANFTRARTGRDSGRAERIRVLRGGPGAGVLGEVALERDGSFMAEVPADMPIGFESLDSAGRVLSRLAPSIWVRPGENRSCLGCHQPNNRSPRNARPLAVAGPPAILNGSGDALAQHAH